MLTDDHTTSTGSPGAIEINPTDDVTDVDFEPSSTLAAPVAGKINETENPGRIAGGASSSAASTKSTSSSGGGFLGGLKAPQAINEIFDDTDTDTRWKIFQIVQRVRERQWFKTFRSPLEFCSTGNFARPTSKENLVERIRVNSQYFFTNYVLLFIAILAYSIITSPTLLLVIGVFVWMWLYATNHEEIRLFTLIPVSGRVKFAMLTTLTVLTLIYFAGSTITFAAGICAVVVFIHMVFHSSVNPEDVEDFDMLPHDLP